MASYPIHDILPEDPSSFENNENMESEVEDEVDQLDSDSDADAQETDVTRKDGTGGAERIPGHSLLPALRLENIIQAEGKLSSHCLPHLLLIAN